MVATAGLAGLLLAGCGGDDRNGPDAAADCAAYARTNSNGLTGGLEYTGSVKADVDALVADAGVDEDQRAAVAEIVVSVCDDARATGRRESFKTAVAGARRAAELSAGPRPSDSAVPATVQPRDLERAVGDAVVAQGRIPDRIACDTSRPLARGDVADCRVDGRPVFVYIKKAGPPVEIELSGP
ncbi:hypothetical protein DSM112329_00981 [Paraconexibacter sp. AEG42_29]|uniref:Lipoprotein n=1 Tax=Paraconexibacter sp. AEG42_29 TaxID=2997339 RepID=A0AAU7AR78_9ACTN